MIIVPLNRLSSPSLLAIAIDIKVIKVVFIDNLSRGNSCAETQVLAIV